MDKYLYVHLHKLHEHVWAHVDGDSVTYSALLALNLRPDWNQSSHLIPHYIFTMKNSLLRVVYGLNEQRIGDYAEAKTVKMRPGQHVSLGHLRQLVVSFWLIKLFLQILSTLIKLPEEITQLVGKKYDLQCRERWAVAKHSALLQGSSPNVICICWFFRVLWSPIYVFMQCCWRSLQGS